MKSFSDDIEAVGAFDWDGLVSKPIQEAALAVKQALCALEGAEGTIFHSRMRILRIARTLKLWTLDIDPEVGQPFMTERRWIQALWPKSYRYCLDAWETEEALEEVPMTALAEITGANLKVLREVSSGVRKKPSVLKAAREMTKDQLIELVTTKHGQHIEPVRVMPKVDVAKFEHAVEMVMAVEECNRAEALTKIAELIEQEYLVPYEHRQEAG